MPGEKDKIFSSKVKYSGLFHFSDFYKFCYEWLTDEFGLLVVEEQYVEKIKGDSKDIDIVWQGTKEVSDYFKFDVSIKFRILGMQNVEVTQDGLKTKMNKAVNVEVKIGSSIIKDYKGKFEENAFKKFLRGIYEKWVIPSRISQYEDKLVGDSDEFLSQVKSYLDLEGKR
jgi:hypothetical protein